MSTGITQLHSHSGLERELKFPKHIVLVDVMYAPTFMKQGVKVLHFKHNGVEYIKIPILDFVANGGIFKNLSV